MDLHTIVGDLIGATLFWSVWNFLSWVVHRVSKARRRSPRRDNRNRETPGAWWTLN